MSSSTKRSAPKEDGSDAETTKKAKVTSSQSTEQIFALGMTPPRNVPYHNLT